MLGRKSILQLVFCEKSRFSQLQCRFVQSQAQEKKFRSKIEIPRKKTWSNIAVLQSLNESIKMDPQKNEFYPLTSQDFAPGSRIVSESMTKSIENAENVVNFVKTEVPDLMKLQWAGSGIPQTDSTKLSPPAEIIRDSKFEKLENYLNEQDWHSVKLEFDTLMQNGVTIPVEFAEKIVALVCFAVKHENRLSQESDLFQAYTLIIDSMLKTNFTKYMACAVLRKQSASGHMWKAGGSFNFLLTNKLSVDKRTAEMLMECCSYHGNGDNMVEEVLEMSFKHAPTAVGIICAGRAFSLTMPPEARLKLWGKCLKEMELCNVKPNLNIYGQMLRYSIRILKDSNVAYAIIRMMSDNPTGPFHYGSCMHDAMRFAVENENLQLATQVYETANRLQHHSDSNYTYHSSFYIVYVQLLARHGTLEEFFTIASHILRQRKNFPWKLLDSVSQICVERNWPQVLPFLFSLLYDTMVDMNYFSQWFEAALVLIESADADTVTQLKHIAIMIRKNSQRISEVHLNKICLLIAKSKDEAALNNFLLDIKRRYKVSPLEPSTLEECKNILGEDSNVLNKLS